MKDKQRNSQTSNQINRQGQTTQYKKIITMDRISKDAIKTRKEKTSQWKNKTVNMLQCFSYSNIFTMLSFTFILRRGTVLHFLQQCFPQYDILITHFCSTVKLPHFPQYILLPPFLLPLIHRTKNSILQYILNGTRQYLLT